MKIKIKNSKISSKFYVKNIKRKIRKIFKNVHSRKKRQKHKIHEAKEIYFASRLNFEKDIDGILEIAPEIDEYLKISRNHKILLNHSRINDISIGALLYLVGQISRINKVLKVSRQAGLKYRDDLGINANNEKIKYLFYKIGYWKYFGINNRPYEISDTSVKDSYFLEIHSSNEWKPELLNKTRAFIEQETDFFQKDYEKIYQFDDIVKEAMGNSLEHAYPKDFNEVGKDQKRWWVCGHYDKQENCLDLVFYDYGVGIRRSMKNNLGEDAEIHLFDKVKDKLKEDADLIELAINGDLSKYKNYKERDRGKGLKRFKNFAKECGYNCELVIVSNKGKYKFCYNHTTKQEQTFKDKLKREIDGMFIKWRIKL
ncbi:hypothetical protein [Campylobacter californiensis]|uniref:hypothetical protein n=1 Tax=Campylobacter californiensis TaxID=1032243 RepID=UPI00147282A8|nr:hypothetical protein [Campylobacter sp. RM12916]MBE3610508.1 hypothetical protein [Campylobacter sp. RM12916]